MNLRLDHIVHFVYEDIDLPIKFLDSKGLHAVRGGRHAAWGTENSIFHAGLSYIEFLRIIDQDKSMAADNPLIAILASDKRAGDGLGQICFRTDDILRLKSDLNRKKVKTSTIINGQRLQENGQLLKWKMLFIVGGNQKNLPMPFFIEWEESDDSRMQRLINQGILQPQNKELSIHAILIAVRSVAKTVEEWAGIFDLDMDDMVIDDPEWGAKRKAFTLGDANLVFLEPFRNSPLTKILESKGERPVAIQFSPGIFSTYTEFLGAYYR
ncbi:VOC family protein [Falsibacillus albus]|uniref:VOC family protein n=1 Tax=Falsibacillus albus TaxID=2478915 RepID=A0A3L7JXE0_9BACI|nr:VOC family protein [Falsibacillus albus]RLQ95403.1 VOC family protein [Falsibacillus albus]